MRERKEYIDIAKFIGIICVLVGHTDFGSIKAGMGPIMQIGDQWFSINVWSFHMPLFFILSGYTFVQRSIRELLKKSLRLLVAYASSILAMVGYYFFFTNDHYTARLWLLGGLYGTRADYDGIFYVHGIQGFWFLLALFWARIIVSYILRIPEKSYQLITVIAVSYLGMQIHSVFPIPWCITNAMAASLFVYIGYVFGEYALFDRLSFFGGCVALFLWLFTNQIDGFIVMAGADLSSIIAVLGSILGTIMIVELAKILGCVRYVNIVCSFLGRITMYIFCVHIFEIHSGISAKMQAAINSLLGFDIHMIVYRTLLSFGLGILLYFIVNKSKEVINERNKH